jgi:hypothetical protein
MTQTQFSCRTVRSMNFPTPLKGSRNSKIRILHEFALQKCMTFRAFPDKQGMKLESIGDSFSFIFNESAKKKQQS